MNVLTFKKKFNLLHKVELMAVPMWRTVARKVTWQGVSIGLLTTVSAVASMDAAALPLFARQTGQNCQACHAGGKFPELTPYGRMFKLTGYTLGKRQLIPIAATLSFSSTSAPSASGAPGGAQNGGTGTQANGTPTFDKASLFAGGKLTDSIGAMAQYTFNNYSGSDDNHQAGRIYSNNADIRYAKHIINDQMDLVWGIDVNNNPGFEDVWNSSGVYGYGVVPGAVGTGSAVLPMLLSQQLGQSVVGAGAYAYWNKTLYVDLAGYRTGDGVFSFMTHNYNGQQTYIQGTNPYVRVALTHDWGASNAMIGYTYLDANVYESGAPMSGGGNYGNVGGPVDEHRDNMVDFQYQYLSDPHVVTVEMEDANEQVLYGGGGATDTSNAFQAKASYTFEAHYGTALSYFNVTNSSNNVTATNPGGTLSNGAGAFQTADLGSEGWTPEIFFMPVRNVRIGLQYTLFSRDNGTTLNASQNDTTFLYAWTAF